MSRDEIPPRDYEAIYRTLTRRYGDLQPEALQKVLCPLHVPIVSINPTVFRQGSIWRASFTAEVNAESREVLQPGRTGKFVPAAHLAGGPWREIAKGRITGMSQDGSSAAGEVYVGESKGALEVALGELSDGDYLEIDQYGASAKVLSALAEAELATQLTQVGYEIRRMPEDTAAHLGVYPNYDFDVVRADGEIRKVEVKSLWGTNTKYARLIHSKSTGVDKGQPNFYATSSCKFATQDAFAVSLFLRTGDISSFAFARSVPDDIEEHGLRRSSKYRDYVNQNPLCEVGDGTWFGSLDEVWDLN